MKVTFLLISNHWFIFADVFYYRKSFSIFCIFVFVSLLNLNLTFKSFELSYQNQIVISQNFVLVKESIRKIEPFYSY